MIVDSSALIAVVNRKSDVGRHVEAMLTAPRRPPTSLRHPWCWRDAAAGHELDAVPARAGIEPVPVEQMEVARQAWRRFATGNHPAALNFSDCFAYAPARVTDEPLLFKGDGFSRTDISAAQAYQVSPKGRSSTVKDQVERSWWATRYISSAMATGLAKNSSGASGARMGRVRGVSMAASMMK